MQGGKLMKKANIMIVALFGLFIISLFSLYNYAVLNITNLMVSFIVFGILLVLVVLRYSPLIQREQDERTFVIAKAAVQYSWVLTFLLITTLFVLSILGFVLCSNQTLLGIVLIFMIFSYFVLNLVFDKTAAIRE
jgi:hypothetical protein